MIFDDPEKSIPMLLSVLNMLVITDRTERNTRGCSLAQDCG